MNYPNYIFDLYGTLTDICTDEESPLLWNRTALWYREQGADWRGAELRKRYLELCRQEQSYFPTLSEKLNCAKFSRRCSRRKA